MDSIKLDDFKQALPDQMPISVIMERRPSKSEWINFSFDALGVVTAENAHGSPTQGSPVSKIHEQNGIQQYLFSGLTIKLFKDECESYYHNLMSPQPGCFVVADQPDDPDLMPAPYLVSLSFDEVHSYLEGGENVYSVDIPPELYKWTEAFVLTQYISTRKVKRKLKDWKKQGQGNISLNGKL